MSAQPCHVGVPPQEEVGRWWAPQERETRPLQRPRPERLFGAPERGNRYALQVEGHLNGSGSGASAELTLVWDRTGVPGGSVSGGEHGVGGTGWGSGVSWG